MPPIWRHFLFKCVCFSGIFISMKPNVKYLLFYIKEAVKQTLSESEYYVDKDGYAHDDEGNKWLVGNERKHTGRPADETHGGLKNVNSNKAAAQDFHQILKSKMKSKRRYF